MTPDSDPLSTIRQTLKVWRAESIADLRSDRAKFWPSISDRDFGAIERALGDISVDEARASLWRLEREIRRGLRDGADDYP